MFRHLENLRNVTLMGIPYEKIFSGMYKYLYIPRPTIKAWGNHMTSVEVA